VDDGTFRELRERCIKLLERRKIERRWYGYLTSSPP
jgi:hypothetical protein